MVERRRSIAPTFRDRHLERRLATDGFVVLPQLATGHLADLLRVHEHHVRALRREQPAPTTEEERLGAEWEARQHWTGRMGPGARWRNGVDELTLAEKHELFEQLSPACTDLADRLFVDHRLLVLSLLDKRQGADGVLPLHHDPTFVPEEGHRSVTLWIALDDIDARTDNGPLHVLPGSHLVAEDLRGTRIEPGYVSGIQELWSRTLSVGVRAGDAVVWDSRLLHGSSPNRSGCPRRAVVAVAIPGDARLVHAVAGEDGHVQVVPVDDSFYRWSSFRTIRDDPPADRDSTSVPRRDPPDARAYLAAADRRRRRLALRAHLATSRWRGRRISRRVATHAPAGRRP